VNWRALLLRLAIIAVALAAWEAAPRLGWVDPDVLPPFSILLRTLAGLLGDQRFITNTLMSAGRVLAAFAIAAPLAVACGIFIGERLYLDRAVSPLIHLAVAVPQSIFLPIFILAFGIGFVEKLVFGATHVVFVVLISTITAMRSMPSGYLLAARSFGASPAQIYAKFYLPAMVPYLMTGLRLGLILDVHAVLLSEMYASRDGLGQQIFAWADNFRMKEMLAAVLLVASCTIVINETLRHCEHRLGRWRLLTAR
jgi:ABC-type nitrate/sulfonate/bicarbonate transport system permease component